MSACSTPSGAAAESGQVAVEAMLLMVMVALALLLPWQGATPPAEQLRRAINDFMQATLIAISMI